MQPSSFPAARKILLLASRRPIAFDAGLFLIVGLSATLYVFSLQKSSSDLELGSDLLTRARYSQAIQAFDRAIGMNNSADAHILRARAYRLSGDSKNSRRDYDFALKLQPENGAALLGLGKLSFDEKNYKKAIDYFTSCIRFSTGNQQRLLEARNSLASAYMCDGRFERAAEVYEDISYSNDKDAGALLNSARCWLALHRIDLAVQDCTKALKIQPNSIEALLVRASCYTEGFDRTNAQKDLDLAVKLEPKNPVIFCARGEMFAHFKNFSNAYKDFAKAISLKSNFYPAYLERARTYLINGEPAKCSEELSSLTDMAGYKPDVDYLFTKALLLKSQQKYQESLHLSQEASLKDPINAAKCYLNIASCYFSLKQFDSAMNYCDKVLKDQPNNSNVLLLQADINQAIGNENAAKLNLFQAVAIEPLNPEVFEKRAAFFLAKKQFGAASEDYRSALKLDPSNTLLSEQLKFCQKNAQAMAGRTNASNKFGVAGNNLSPGDRKKIAESDAQELIVSGYKALKESKLTYALAALSRAVNLKPNDPVVRRYLAYALISSGDFDGAIEQFFAWEKLEKISIDDEIAFVKSIANAGEREKARELIEQLFKKYSKDPASLLKLARLCEKLKFYSIAATIVKRGLEIASPDQIAGFKDLSVSLDHIEIAPPPPTMQANPIGKS